MSEEVSSIVGKERRRPTISPTLVVFIDKQHMLVRAHLKADSADVYNTKCKRFIVPFAVAYLFVYTSVSLSTWWRGGGAGRPLENNVTHHSADCGLRMQLNQVDVQAKSIAGFSYFSLIHRSHALAAMSLFFVCIYQKHNVQLMASLAKRASATKDYRMQLQEHRFYGKVGLLLVLAMDLCGLLMGPFSSWEKFTTFNFFFFAPWLFMVGGIYGCATSKLIKWHRYFGNMLLKGCIATPIARIMGSLLQQLKMLYGFNGWDDSHGFYYGIGAVTLIISLWQGKDTLDVLMGKYEEGGEMKED